jgi:hypothetical protein
MIRQLTVDFNRAVEGSLIRANARRAVDDVVFEVGATVVVGDDDWGLAPAEVVEIDHTTCSMVLRLTADLVDEHSRP